MNKVKCKKFTKLYFAWQVIRISVSKTLPVIQEQKTKLGMAVYFIFEMWSCIEQEQEQI